MIINLEKMKNIKVKNLFFVMKKAAKKMTASCMVSL